MQGTLIFEKGQTSKLIEVTVLDDVHDEGSETLTLNLSNPKRGTIIDGTAVGTITNTDGSSQQTQADPLTLSHPLPPHHDGSPFTFRLTFSAAVTIAADDLGAALAVGGGDETAVTDVDADGVAFEITITPAGTGSVSVLLPVAADCEADGAICTVGGVALSVGMAAFLPYVAPAPADPLTASFTSAPSAPSAHDGSTAFTLDLVFSEAPAALGLATVRPSPFSGGRVGLSTRIGKPPGPWKGPRLLTPDNTSYRASRNGA